MDIRSLRYFVETVRLNSFTQAAEALNVTQSTISKMVRQLEDELDARLLVRDGRKLALTDTGRIVFERGEQMLATLRLLTLEVRDTQQTRRGSLTVGIPPMINLLFTPVLKVFRERHPDIDLSLREDTGQAIERQIAAGELEIGMTVLPADPALDVVAVQIASYPIWALAAEGTFQQGRSTLELKALGALPLVLLKDDFALTRSLRAAFRAAGFEPSVAAQSGQWDWLVAMASAGLGVALLPEPFIHRLAGERLDAVRIVAPELAWQVAHVWNGRYLSHAARAWLAVCQSVLGTSFDG
ncbi:LysR substrate-binding domain-containing protein [Janthinobacterium fluminis]|uniref:LysR substrate-binding domain-containing protein n=1 Tax=Janthinobacterium fluminis TaxID=2987524 RepID=A0ABT5K721_9BURK|nr:LysR substrate-binding domain-containing protein [Janthinobacterium fluminis]MDC8760802.1 LysR substrate-binding domain-containing protein [Janthinobacterium fluminis]